MKRLFLIIAVLILFVALAAPPDSFCKEKTKIRVMLSYDLTGPYSGLHREIDAGARMYMEYWKANELVPGVEIVYDIYDSGTNADKIRAAIMDSLSKEPKPVLALDGLSSALGVVVKPMGERFKLPILGGSSARGILFPPSWSFSVQPDYPSLLGAVGNWIKDNWKPDSDVPWIKKHYENRNPRLAVMGWDNAFGRGIRAKESDEYLKKIGVDFVGEEYFPYAPKDTTPNLRRLKRKGVDFIYFGCYPAAHAIVLKDAQRLKMRDDFMDIAFYASDPVLLMKHGGEELVNNTIIFTGYEPRMENLPDFIQKWLKEDQKIKPGDNIMSRIILFSWLDLWREVIQKAVDKVGAENVTGEVCYDIITNEIKDFEPIAASCALTFSKTKTFGPSKVDAFVIRDGKLVTFAKDVALPNLAPKEYR